jgi:hypothetical protein
VRSDLISHEHRITNEKSAVHPSAAQPTPISQYENRRRKPVTNCKPTLTSSDVGVVRIRLEASPVTP